MNYLCEICHKVITEKEAVLLLEIEWLKFKTGAFKPEIRGVYANHRHYVCIYHVENRYTGEKSEEN